MIKLKDILKELDFGKYPFTDVNAVTIKGSYQDQFKELINRWKYVEEPNTKDEAKFIKSLTRYFKSAKNPISVADLNQLLTLKSKYPNILDPSINADYKTLYRGTSIPIKDVLKYSWTKTSFDLYECNTPITINSKTTRGFTSFSISENTAKQFAEDSWPDGEDDSEYIDTSIAMEAVNTHLVPAVVSISTTDPNTLFNPEFTALFNIHADEGEVLYIGNSYKSTKTKIVGLDSVLNGFVATWTKSKYDTEWMELADHLKIKLIK
jgi:hypothetical protein